MKNNFLNYFCTALFCLQVQAISTKPDPLSKLVITSNSATCKKNKTQKNYFCFTYKDNVLVTLADNSTIQSDTLEIEIDTSKIQNKIDNKQTPNQTSLSSKKSDDISHFKKITFNKNLIIKNANRKITADRAELYLAEKTCKLFDNIKIEQKKAAPKDLPITTECHYALLDLRTDQIALEGQEQKPVCTTIILEGHPGLLKKPKTKEERRAERKLKKQQNKISK